MKKLIIKELKFVDCNQHDDVYLTVDKCSTEVILEAEKWLNSNELLWVKIYADGLASYGLTMMEDPLHGGKYTWSSRAEIINKELLKGTPCQLITSDIGVKELEGKYSCYFSRGICASVIMPLIERHADKLHHGLEEFKRYELRYVSTESHSLTREEAITAATKYGLQGEVIYEMDHNGLSPEEALAEWDIL